MASTSSAPACPRQQMDSAETVRSYKALAEVERAFRSTKTLDLQLSTIVRNTCQPASGLTAALTFPNDDHAEPYSAASHSDVASNHAVDTHTTAQNRSNSLSTGKYPSSRIRTSGRESGQVADSRLASSNGDERSSGSCAFARRPPVWTPMSAADHYRSKVER
jgi:hypothetical protein